MSRGSIPVIDMAGINQPEILRAIDMACRDWGCFMLMGHAIDESISSKLIDHMREFFTKPTAYKQAISRTKDNPWGFFDQELTKNTLDWKEVFDYGPPDNKGTMAPQWPSDMPEFVSAVMDFYQASESLAFKLLAAISVNLGMPTAHLEQHYRPEHSSFLRLNYFPVCPTPAPPEATGMRTEGCLGINQHTDAGALTVLLHDQQPGVEIFRNDHWHLLRPLDGALMINIGDIVQVWSNDRYQAPLHRVRASSTHERYSAPFFFNPSYCTDYMPLPSTTHCAEPARYRSINWGEFRAARAAGDHADIGEEVQISQFRTDEHAPPLERRR